MNRFFAFALAVLLALSLGACSREQAPETTGIQPAGPAQATEPTDGADAPTVERSAVKVLSGISIGVEGGEPLAYQWETLDRRLMATMTTQNGDAEAKLTFNYREGERAGTVTGLQSGVTVDFGWDESGRVISMKETSSGGTYAVDFTYDSDGRCTERVISRNGEYACTVTSVYEDGRLTNEITVLPDGSVSNQRLCTYNGNGDLTVEELQWTGSPKTVKKYTYTYDDSGRALTRITLDGEDVQTEKHTYTYDSEGRVLTRTAYSGDTRTSHTEYTYDENGALVKECLFSAGDSADQTVEYTYTEVWMSNEEHTLYQMLLDQSRTWY